MHYHTRERNVHLPIVRAVRKALKGQQTVYIVGKGPSLDDLTKEDFDEFPNAPIICINESVHAIEKLDLHTDRLFCIQHDLMNHINRPKRAQWLLSEYGWQDQQGDYSKDIRYDRLEICQDKPNLTVCVALSLSSLAGANQAVMLAFDAAFAGDCNYASSINRTHHLEDQDDNRFVHFAQSHIPQRAAEEGMNLIWQSPKSFWYIGLVLRSGGIYTQRHVEIIEEQLANLSNSHKTVLFTDQYTVPAWFKVPLQTLWPGLFSKLEMFSPSINLRGGILYTDLDNYFGKPFTLPRWDTLEKGILYAHEDPWRPLKFTSVMAWRLGTVTDPYICFKERPVISSPTDKNHDDQVVVTEALKYRVRTPDFIRVKSWKAHKPKPEEVDCVAFHGNPKPWDVGLVKL